MSPICVHAKFNNDQLWNEKALVRWKSDNNKTKKNKNTVSTMKSGY